MMLLQKLILSNFSNDVIQVTCLLIAYDASKELPVAHMHMQSLTVCICVMFGMNAATQSIQWIPSWMKIQGLVLRMRSDFAKPL